MLPQLDDLELSMNAREALSSVEACFITAVTAGSPCSVAASMKSAFPFSSLVAAATILFAIFDRQACDGADEEHRALEEARLCSRWQLLSR